MCQYVSGSFRKFRLSKKIACEKTVIPRSKATASVGKIKSSFFVGSNPCTVAFIGRILCSQIRLGQEAVCASPVGREGVDQAASFAANRTMRAPAIDGARGILALP